MRLDFDGLDFWICCLIIVFVFGLIWFWLDSKVVLMMLLWGGNFVLYGIVVLCLTLLFGFGLWCCVWVNLLCLFVLLEWFGLVKLGCVLLRLCLFWLGLGGGWSGYILFTFELGSCVLGLFCWCDWFWRFYSTFTLGFGFGMCVCVLNLGFSV